jgi:AcrR family transcriptional regulator
MVYIVYVKRLSTCGKIVSAAQRLLDRQGAEAVTMRRVAAAVGVTPMALYRHFEDRDALLNTLADAGFEELARRVGALDLPEDPEKQLRRILDVFLDFALEQPHLFELMFLHKRAGARQFPGDFRTGKSPTAKFAAAALEAGMKRGIFQRDDVWEITFEVGALLQGLVMLYQGGRVGVSEAEFRALCHGAFGRYLNGIRR